MIMAFLLLIYIPWFHKKYTIDEQYTDWDIYVSEYAR